VSDPVPLQREFHHPGILFSWMLMIIIVIL